MMLHMFQALKHIFHLILLLLDNFTTRKNSIAHFKMDDTPKEKEEKIYLSIDHLKAGTYKLNILLKNKIVKTIKFIKR